MDLHPTIQPNHSFFWNTSLPVERMRAISDWIGSLTPAQRQMLDELLSDVIEEADFNNNYEG